jgi:excisionase family DNA binding protein
MRALDRHVLCSKNTITRRIVTTQKAAGSMGLLTIAATAARLACSDMHIYRLIAAGQLDAVDIAQPGARKSKTRVTDASVSRYIESRTRRVGTPRPAA